MKSPVLHFFDIAFSTEYEDTWRFGYSIFDKEHISIWKNGIEHKVRVIDVGKKDGKIWHNATKDPVEITGGVKALFNDWYKALIGENNTVFDNTLAKNEIINLYNKTGSDD